MKKRIIIPILMFSCVLLNAQFKDLGNFMAAGPQDAQKLFEGYVAPYFNAFGASLTGGWYNTAKPHQLGGFDITATFNTAIVPVLDRTFDVAELGLGALRLADPAQNIAPTIAGKKDMGPALNYNIPGINQKAFDLPKGVGLPAMSSPMLQLGIGLIKDTEINGRYMPTYTPRLLKETNIGMWGLGFKHGLKQYIPGIKKVPVLHLTLQYGYTQLNADVGINVDPTSIGAAPANDVTNNWEDQKIDFVTKSHTGNLLISANLPVVCFYGGVGFATTKTTLGLKGDFPSIDAVESARLAAPTVTNESILTDPINIEFKNSDGSTTKPRLNVGMRLKFGVITLHGDYTYANYSLVSGGIGISFR